MHPLKRSWAIAILDFNLIMMQRDVHTWCQGKNWWTTILALLTNAFSNYACPGNHLLRECDCHLLWEPAPRMVTGEAVGDAQPLPQLSVKVFTQRGREFRMLPRAQWNPFFLVDSCNSLLMHGLRYRIKHHLSTGAGSWFPEMSVNMLCTLAQSKSRNARFPQELEPK